MQSCTSSLGLLILVALGGCTGPVELTRCFVVAETTSDRPEEEVLLVRRVVWEYDAEGNASTAEYDAAADGLVDWRWTYTYDMHGNLLSASRRDDDGGLRQRFAYTYDGGLLRQVIEEGRESPDAPALRETGRLVYTYSEDGDLLTRESFGPGPDSRLERRERFTYDVDGRRGACEWQQGLGFGRHEYGYDASGNRVTAEADWGHLTESDTLDGVIDFRWTWTYDLSGRVRMQEGGWVDAALGASETTTWTYGTGVAGRECGGTLRPPPPPEPGWDYCLTPVPQRL